MKQISANYVRQSRLQSSSILRIVWGREWNSRQIKGKSEFRANQITGSWIQQTYPSQFTSAHNRPLALRGHVTKASLKQWVVILLMLKIDRTHKNYLTRNLRGNAYFMALWFFNKLAWFVFAAMLVGILLPSNLAPKLLLAYILLLEMFDSYVQMCYKHLTTFNNIFLEV